MGWWSSGEDGASFANSELIWGDGPADIMDNALDKIVKEFQEDWQRKPTRKELIAGLLFSINVDYPEES